MNSRLHFIIILFIKSIVVFFVDKLSSVVLYIGHNVVVNLIWYYEPKCK